MPPQPRHHDTLLRAVFLGSGSSGNATAITDGTTTLLLDCGFSARECARRLGGSGIAADSVSAVLVTHEHRDHTTGVEVFARRHGAPVFATGGTLRASGLGVRLADARVVRSGETRRVGTLDVTPFRTSHDAEEPVGFRIEAACGTTLVIATDTGVLTQETADALEHCDIVGIECNHDAGMLDTGPYPYFLKARIRSDRGHLSNADAAAAIARAAGPRLRAVFALHVSTTNNTPELAEQALREQLAREGMDVPVKAARQNSACFSEGAVP